MRKGARTRFDERVRVSPDQLPDDAPALKQIITAMAQDAIAAQAEIAKLRFQLARYRRAEFGRSSEKLEREAEQLELAIEALETDQAERIAAASPVVAAAIEAQKPARRPLPEHLPREDMVHAAPCTCPTCGGALRRIGEEITETLDYVPGRFKVIRHIREKLSCRSCDMVVAAPAPDHAIARGRAGAGLLAHIVVSKYDDHLPLYRQAEIFARVGVKLETSTLSGWVAATAAAVAPLIDALIADVMASDTLHVDDTPVPVLAPGNGKTKTGRLWVYVRDERPFAGARPPAALFFYSPDRKGAHPRAHLKEFRGIIHADGYAGFNELFAGNRIVEAGCWAHVRRKFFDVHAANGSPIAKEALDRIGQLYGVEEMIRASRPITDDGNARSARSRSPRHWPPGPTRLCASCRANPSWPPPSAICGRAGLHSSAASTTAGSRSIIIRPSGRYAALQSAARITCSPAPTPAVAAPRRCTR
jgi:transposase